MRDTAVLVLVASSLANVLVEVSPVSTGRGWIE